MRTGGKWQKVLPGVYSAVTGKLTAEQRHVAALMYAGSASVITGPWLALSQTPLASSRRLTTCAIWLPRQFRSGHAP